MSGVNKVIIIGRLGADPDLKSTQGGAQVCTLSIATSETWVKDGKKEERTEWHRIVLWGRQAELAQKYLKKGRMVYIEGRLQTRSWQDQQGQKRYTTEIVANNLQFIDGGSQSSHRDHPQDSPGASDEFNDSYYQPSGQSMYDGAKAQDSFQNQSRTLDDDIPF